MANEKLKLKELGVRVEATFEWPGQPDGSAPISMPEAATEIGERLQALEERLAPVARGPEAPAQLGAAAADPVVPPAAEATVEVAQVERLLEKLERRLDGQLGPANDLARMAARLEDLEARPASPSALVEAPERLRAVEERLDNIETLLGDLAGVDRRIDALEKAVGLLRPLRTALAEIGPRLDALEDVAGEIHDLPDELARVPAKILELEQRLQKPVPSLEELAALTLRIRGIEERPYVPASLPTDLAEITARLNALEQRPVGPASSPLELAEVTARLEDLERQADESVGVVEEVASLALRLKALEERPSTPVRPTREAADIVTRSELLENDRDEPLGVHSAPEPRDPAEPGRDVFASGPSNHVVQTEFEAGGSGPGFDGGAGLRSDVAMSVAAERSDSGRGSAEPAGSHAQPRGDEGYSEVPREVPSRPLRSEESHLNAGQESRGTTHEATSATPENEAEVLELLRKEIASLHTEFGPLTVAPDASAPRAGSAAPDPVPASGQANRRFKKGLRRGESES